jgi:hypothetical protein
VRRSVIKSTGPASPVSGVGVDSVAGPIATESNRWILGAEVDDDGSAADAEAAVVKASVDIDNGSVDGCDADIAAFDDGSNLVFLLAVSDMAEMVGKEESMGDVVGIETSLRGPCEPAPVLVESSRLLSSTGRNFDGICALGKESLAVEA